MRGAEENLIPYLDRLRDLPFVMEAEVVALNPATAPGQRADAELRLRTPLEKHCFLAEVKRTHLTRTIVDGVLARMEGRNDPPWILFAPHIGRPIGQYLNEQNVNFIDRLGNCRLQIGQEYFALVQGKRSKPETRGRGIGLAGYRVLFALLARNDLLNVPVRTLADAANVSKNAAAHAIARLTEDGVVGEENGRRRFLDRNAVLDQWLAGYAATVRPKLLVGTFQTPYKDPDELERRIEEVLGAQEQWVWGGGAAAIRLTRFYRGPETVLHVPHWRADFPRQLKALKAHDGPLVVLRPLEQLALEGVVPRTAHPLMVYTELLATGGPRAREAAADIQRKYLAQ
jgi:hypothetical protein